MKSLGYLLVGAGIGALLSNESSRSYLVDKAKSIKDSVYNFFTEEVEVEDGEKDTTDNSNED